MSESLFERLQVISSEKGISKGGIPPVHLWNPDRIYDIDIKIDAEGCWFHEGSEIKRIQLVKLFASILKKEGDDYFLVTPVEKARIHVEDVPFIVVEMEYSQVEDKFFFRTNLGDVVEMSDQHTISLNKTAIAEQKLPYLLIRSGLLARLNRNVYYQAIELAEQIGDKLFLKTQDFVFCIGEL